MDTQIDLSGDDSASDFAIDEIDLDSLSIRIGGLTLVISDSQYESLKEVVREWSGL